MDINELLDKSRRKSDSYAYHAPHDPDKYPKDVKELVDKKIASEYQFNKHARVQKAKSTGGQSFAENKRRNSTVTDNDISALKMKYQRHNGDQNITDNELSASRKLSETLTAGYDDDDSDLETLPNNVSPLMIRRHSHSQENPQIGTKIDIHMAKLAQMKLKLDPLPNRQRTKSLVSGNDEDH